MARSRNSFPSYLKHASGKARAVWTDALGIRHFRMLPGPFDSAESRAAFARFQLELETDPHRAARGDPEGASIAEVLVAYLEHAGKHYRHADGSPTSEIHEVKAVVKALRETYGDTPASAFGPIGLKSLRTKWVKDGLSRSGCNRRVGIVKRIFRWALSEQIVPAATFQAVAAVESLKAGRTDAPDLPPVRPAVLADVEAASVFMAPAVAALVRLQIHSAARAGELVRLRAADIDRSDPDVWLFAPAGHKGSWRGKARTIYFGAKCRAVLAPFLLKAGGPDEFLFTTGRKPRGPYTTEHYRRVIKRACEKAGVPVFTPHQLRHLAATTARAEFGVDVARALCGHSLASVTERYSNEVDAKLAMQAARKLG